MRCWADHVALPHPSPPLSPQADSTRRRPAAPMETVVGKHPSPSQQRCHAVCPGAESGSGVVANRPAADFRVQSPSDASSLVSSRASSRESLFSDGWDRERSWSAMQLSGAASPPLSPSRGVSPCSSARSGAFTPTVVRVRRHALASGSSMLHLPRASCQSSCESLAESEGARSPPPLPRRHRPPLTRLSLLTAILRKGRLPVLSPALQRPYSPCWPINHITLASCAACSAASGLPPVSPRAALSPSPPADPAGPDEGTEPTRPPPSRLCCYSGARSPGPKGGANQTDPGSSADEPRQTSPAKQKQPSPKTTAAGNFSARRVCSPPPLPATARLDCISPPPRSLQSCLKQHQPFASQTQSHSHEPPKYPATKSPAPGNTSIPGPGPVDSPRDAASPVPVPRSSSCLSPSRYAPIVFPGWPSPNGSRSCTPDRFTLSPSPASQARDLTPRPSPCPSPSLRSTPTSAPQMISYPFCLLGDSQPHKIKSSYKSLAAIPTNTLLLDQQVKLEEPSPDCSLHSDIPVPSCLPSQMCSPAQLRQESEELYAVIDKILEDGVPKVSDPSEVSTQVIPTHIKCKQTGMLRFHLQLCMSIYVNGISNKRISFQPQQ
uniref:Uncharacterized protein n=1 Tax=Gadus morhua TaxID=8049 RepID=A0A8C5B704_GADMO